MKLSKSIIGFLLIEFALLLFAVGLMLNLLSLDYYPQAIALVFFYIVAVYHFKFQN
ncbi:hypothetical protein IIC68_00285 [archaeon]|nr:hypothetical protein [archaeon]